jgi:hypothetical protein
MQRLCVFLFLLALLGQAQAPTGSIAGTVLDETGAVMPGVAIVITNKATGAQRRVTSDARGAYEVPSLFAGEYEIRAEAKGFRTLVRSAEVQTGITTNAELRMVIGATTEVVNVEGAGAQISYDSNKIDGVVTRKQIENLPLNGRNFLQLAFLEPGVTVNTASLAQYNAQFSVSVLGGDAGRTAINADGGNIRDRTTGNTSQNISQEVVQEFQLSSVNFDLSTGITSVGSVNIVTRQGGNDFHGAAYFFFRDNNMSAFPALRRDPLNPDPFFARRQPGFWLSGPVVKNRLFFFVNYEQNNQDSVFTVAPNAPSLLGFTTIAPTDYTQHSVTARMDWRINASNNFFFRYTHDGNRGFATNDSPPSLPSNWMINTNQSDQYIAGLTSTLSSSFVNDFRFSYVYWKNRNLHPSESDCPGCIGIGGPQVTISGAGFTMGNTSNAPQGRDYDTLQWVNNATWQKGSHRLRFGGELEKDITEGFWGFCEPACITLWSAEVTRQRLPNYVLPAQFRTYQDLLELPLFSMTVGYGSPLSPAPFQRDRATTNYRMRVYFQDAWRITPKFTLNYGLAWSAETTLANHDIDKPQFLQPIIGDLRATRRDWNNVGPAVGFAWNPWKDNKTVIRGGVGMYYDTQFLWERLNERNVIGPRGNGRTNVSGATLSNTIPGLPGVPVGTPLDFRTNPTELRLKHVLQMAPGFQQTLERLIPIDLTNLNIRGINAAKSVTGFATVFPTDYPTSYGYHFNLGIQREVFRDLVVTADVVHRQFLRRNFGTTVDMNRWDSVNPDGSRGEIIPRCVGAQATDINAVCSTGPIQVRLPGARSNYSGLLLKVEKRFARRFQLTGSYAYQRQNAVLTIVNKRDFFEGYGEYGARNVLNVSGFVDLPWGFQISMISAMSSRPPINPTLVGIDLDGDGTGFSFLPGLGVSRLNRGLGKSDLARLVTDFNTQWAGRRTIRNQLVNPVRLPDNYQLGDNFFSQDFRVSKIFTFRERIRLNLFGEVFNAFNIANLGGFSFNLYDPSAFGQPTIRANQIFGSGGPRAFQFGGRFSF